ncbi:hypothetical protein D5086_010394 [Populus alba]|uniref:Terpene synthase n=2 Tax=Populus alba TaxID=43335 RepID=A0A4U5Q9R9_POPAL|nr:hypothetical protein D5086_0000121540 [Populus alba]
MALQESTPKAQFRRTAEFHPSVWGDYFINKAPCDEMLFSAWIKEIEVLKEEVRTMLTSATLKPSEKLKLMDVVLRLGIGYHFEGEFNGIIEHAYNTYHDNSFDDDLFTVALRFRLLREYGYNVSSDIFNEFKDGKGNFKDNLIDDVEGLLSLYEASVLGGHGEETLDKALSFCKTHLESAVAHLVSPLADKVSRALKRPLLKGVPKHEQWHHILIYQQDEACPGAVLRLAKLDFNVLQKCYQDELRIISRWDTSMEDLPDYMKLFFEALIGFFDEIEQETAKEGRPYCVHYSREMLKNQARAYLTEARWFNQDCVPQLEEYRRAGVYTSCYPMAAVAWICGMAETGSKEAFEWMSKNPKIVVASSDIGRLMDDITSHEFEQERGHVASAVECCMKQYGVSKEEAYDMLRKMVESDWKDINEELLKPSTVPRQILILMLNLARIIDVIYKDHDGYTEARSATKELLTAFLVDPLPVVA